VAKAAPVKTPFGKPAAKAVAGPPATKEVNGKVGSDIAMSVSDIAQVI
jgi:hypothetical protein